MKICEEKFGVGVVCGADQVPEELSRYLKLENDVTLLSGMNLYTDNWGDGQGYVISGSKNFKTSDPEEMKRFMTGQNFDIAHAHTRSRKLLEINKGMRKKGVPFIYTVHGRDALSDPISREFMKEADLVTAPSHSTIEEVRSLGIPKEKTVAVYNSTDFTDYKNDSRTTEKARKFRELNSKNGEKIVLCVGRLQEDKGIYETAEAVKELARKGEKIKLVHAGPCFGEDDRKKLENIFKGYENSLSIMGFVDDSDLPALYKSADVMALPSDMRNETFGLVALEALAMETPVIVSYQGGPKEVFVDQGMAIGVKPRNAESIKKGISYVLKNYNQEKKRAEMSSKIIEKFYHTKFSAKLWEGIYRNMINLGA